MKIIIEHRYTKREIVGPFNMLVSKEDLEKMKNVIDNTLRKEFYYGWIEFEEEEKEGRILTQKSIIDQPPLPWD